MDPRNFANNAPGRLTELRTDVWAFIPDPLPPKLELPVLTIKRLAAAERALGDLRGTAQTLPNPHLLVGPFVRREALLSSRIEGTITSAENLAMREAGAAYVEASEDTEEVVNYVAAMNHGLRRLRETPMGLGLIREIHAALMKGVRGNDRHPGEFRQSVVYIGHAVRGPRAARFIPPPPSALQDALERFEHYAAGEWDLPDLVEIALIHYQFETIHPFEGGNGRTGRLLNTLLLVDRGLLPLPLLNLSAYFERHRAEYMNGLLAVSQQGAWAGWIDMFLEAVASQATDDGRRARRLVELRESLRRQVMTDRRAVIVPQVIDALFESPATSVPQISRQFSVTQRAAQKAVDRLMEAGVIVETTGRRRGRVYLSPPILEIIHAPDE